METETRGKRITIYVTDELRQELEAAYELLKQEGSVPGRGDPKKYRTFIIKTCVSGWIANHETNGIHSRPTAAAE